MRTTCITAVLALSIFGGPLHGQTTPQSQVTDLKPNQSVKTTFHGYVRDLACLMKFNEALKPTNDCAAMCARAGSPLVIVTKNGAIYVPMSASIPDTSRPRKTDALRGKLRGSHRRDVSAIWYQSNCH